MWNMRVVCRCGCRDRGWKNGGEWRVGGWWVLLGLCKKKKNITGEWFKKETLYLIYLNLTYSSSQTWKQNKQTQTIIGNVFFPSTWNKSKSSIYEDPTDVWKEICIRTLVNDHLEGGVIRSHGSWAIVPTGKLGLLVSLCFVKKWGAWMEHANFRLGRNEGVFDLFYKKDSYIPILLNNLYDEQHVKNRLRGRPWGLSEHPSWFNSNFTPPWPHIERHHLKQHLKHNRLLFGLFIFHFHDFCETFGYMKSWNDLKMPDSHTILWHPCYIYICYLNKHFTSNI